MSVIGSQVQAKRSGAAAHRFSAAQRVAVIIAVLGEDAARPIVEQLDDVALAKVTSALEDLPRLSREDLGEIVMDFLSVLRGAPGGLTNGSHQARDLILQIVNARRSDAGGSAGTDAGGRRATDGNVWQRLEARSGAEVAAYLSTLSPSLIALVLRKLNSAFASEVLCTIDEVKLLPIMDCMVEAVADDAGIESIIARMIDLEFLTAEENAAEADDSHLESVGEILSLIPGNKRDSLVAFLTSHHEGKLSSIRKSMFTVENLPDMLPRAAVPVVFREMDQAKIIRLISSIQAIKPDVAEFLLTNISARLAGQIRDELKELSAIPEAESELLQREFLSSLMQMKRTGAIQTA
jgi:flagellar motor switch protein FliG